MPDAAATPSSASTPPTRPAASASSAAAADPSGAAIALLARNGYDNTTVEEIAAAAGMSRTTFFRRFKSKDDIVFADHETLLSRVNLSLAEATGNPLIAVAEAGQLVFDHHVRRRETSLARFSLLHNVASLRDREFITTRRYEREFARYLLTALPDSPRREYGAVAFASSIVAVHNQVLRQWLSDPDTERTALLRRELRSIVAVFTPMLLPDARPSAPAVLVSVFDPTTDPAAILEAITNALDA
ncbi:TetR/AcrR family transcriptional regulator [Subtercola lobariae]|uniref:HTH tetR-type domain-containing protein n=1 Tax=Subtercola lobariae TaxID=1588641 RepID=A0A917B4N6_9MICO|nr:TetR/AcrR family transcriptional regulator [Subtercola lobariae]GGF21608.1 hypothetical protein GCM10011399_14150 [Subtercola lobariae]